MGLFGNVDRATLKELRGIHKALERLADSAELHLGADAGSQSLRSFYTGENPEDVEGAELAYVDEEEAWTIEQAEKSGLSLEDFRQQFNYGGAKAEDVE